MKNRLFMHFNSTMVRLKDKENRMIKHKLQKFQFHYGTIKRKQGAITQKLPYISIPLWYD